MSTIGVVVFAFGPEPELFSNRILGKIASRYARIYGAPVLRQCGIFLDGARDVESVNEEHAYANTLQMAYAAVEWAGRKGLTELHVAAAGPHLNRALRDTEYAVKNAGATLLVKSCDGLHYWRNQDWFRPESSQWRTRGWWQWWFGWEWWVSSLPWWLYRRLSHVT